MQAAEIDTGAIYVNHVDVKIIDGSWTLVRMGIEGVAIPLIVLPQQMETPNVFLLVQIECKQAVKSRG